MKIYENKPTTSNITEVDISHSNEPGEIENEEFELELETDTERTSKSFWNEGSSIHYKYEH